MSHIFCFHFTFYVIKCWLRFCGKTKSMKKVKWNMNEHYNYSYFSIFHVNCCMSYEVTVLSIKFETPTVIRLLRYAFWQGLYLFLMVQFRVQLGVKLMSSLFLWSVLITHKAVICIHINKQNGTADITPNRNWIFYHFSDGVFFQGKNVISR